MASATWPACSRSSTTSPTHWASTRSGPRRFTPRRWPTSATTSPTTATWTPSIGDLAAFDALVAAAHARGLAIIVDYVPSHTSDQHPWFRASRASRDNPYRDWYVWH